MRYKNITADNIELIYQAVVDQSDGELSLAEARSLVDEYIQGEIDKNDLLADINNELSWIPTAISELETAIAAIPGFNIPAGVKAVLTGLTENQKRIFQENFRQLKVWKFVIKNVKIK